MKFKLHRYKNIMVLLNKATEATRQTVMKAYTDKGKAELFDTNLKDSNDLVKDLDTSNNIKQQLVTNLTMLQLENNVLTPETSNMLENLNSTRKLGTFLNDINGHTDIETFNKWMNIREVRGVTGILADDPEQLEEYKNVKIIKDFGNGLAWVMPLDKNGNPKSECEIEAIVGANCGNDINSDITKYMYMLRPTNMNKKQKTYVVVTVDDDNKIIELLGWANEDVDIEKYGEMIVWLLLSDYIALDGLRNCVDDVEGVITDDATDTLYDIIVEMPKYTKQIINKFRDVKSIYYINSMHDDPDMPLNDKYKIMHSVKDSYYLYTRAATALVETTPSMQLNDKLKLLEGNHATYIMGSLIYAICDSTPNITLEDKINMVLNPKMRDCDITDFVRSRIFNEHPDMKFADKCKIYNSETEMVYRAYIARDIIQTTPSMKLNDVVMLLDNGNFTSRWDKYVIDIALEVLKLTDKEIDILESMKMSD